MQFYNLFTGVMTDQPVTFSNTLTLGGNQSVSTVPLRVYGAIGQNTDLIDLYADKNQAQPGFGFSAVGRFAWGPGGASPQDTFLSRIATQNGHSSDTAGLLITPRLEVAGPIAFGNGATISAPGGSPNQLNVTQDLSVAGALLFTPSGTTITQGASGTQQIAVGSDLRVTRSVVVGTSGGFTSPVTATPQAQMTFSAAPNTLTYAILINTTFMGSTAVGVMALNSTIGSSNTGFVDAIQIS